MGSFSLFLEDKVDACKLNRLRLPRGGCRVHKDRIKTHYSRGKNKERQPEIPGEKHLCKKIIDQI